MIPIAGLDEIKVAWIALQKEGYLIYGFLLYTDSDRVLVDYMSDGIIELDYLSGEDCAVFVIESPSEKWISHTQKKNHTWWNIFGKDLLQRTSKQIEAEEKPKGFFNKYALVQKIIVQNINSSTIVVGDDNTVSLSHILKPKYPLLYDRAEAVSVARHFEVKYKELPCLIFFKDLDGKTIWKKTFSEYEFNSQEKIKIFFRDFFESTEFYSLLRERLF